MRQLSIVLKISERCNMSCKYCYFFFGGDDSYLKHSAVIKENVVDQLSLFIQEGICGLNINHLSIILHGGEPLLLKKTAFIKMLDKIIDKIPKECTYSFLVQINGLLVDEEWIAIFEKYSIGVGVSIDGPKEYHDKYRIDKKGNGTYDRIVDKLTILQNAQDSKKLSGIGCLSVINKDFDPVVIFNHLVKTLRFQNIDLLLPDITHDTVNKEIQKYGVFLCKLFDSWLEHNDKNVRLRYCQSVVNVLLGKNALSTDLNPTDNDSIIISISSDGDLFPDDTLRSTDAKYFEGYNIFQHSLKAYVNSEAFSNLGVMHNTLPDGCKNCCWAKICRGGQMVHRHSKANQFNNPSVMCEALQMFYGHVSKRMIESGVAAETIQSNLI